MIFEDFFCFEKILKLNFKPNLFPLLWCEQLQLHSKLLKHKRNKDEIQ